MSPIPPILDRILLRLLQPPEVREVITGDLEETWRAHPSRLRYWRMTLASVAAWGRHRLRGAGCAGGGYESTARGDGLMQQLMQDPRHRAAKARQGEWLDGYRVEISQVLRTYGDDRLAPHLAPPPQPGVQ